MIPAKIVLHEDGEFRLYEYNETMSFLAHQCDLYPNTARGEWWFFPTPHLCYQCGAVPSDEIMGLYMLHNWDRIQAAK